MSDLIHYLETALESTVENQITNRQNHYPDEDLELSEMYAKAEVYDEFSCWLVSLYHGEET